jgi:hypothetical protein
MAYSSIIKPQDYFNPKAYTGTGSSNALTGVGMQPDWTWIKSRSNTYSHSLTDVVRGITKKLQSNSSNDQYTSTTELTSFNSDGFTVGTDSGVNNNGSTFTSWNWKANGQGSANTAGSINTLYTSANTTAGMSISTYVGVGDVGSRTFGHGLTKAPELVLIKNMDANENWVVGSNYTNTTLPWKYKLTLDNGNVRNESGAYFADTPPSNSLVTIEGNAGVNGSGNTLVAYCFHSVQGYSKMGSYNGQGTTTGQFVYTGFKPSFVMTKIATTGGSDTGGWVMVDNKMYPNNLSNSPILFGNLTNAEETSYNCEFFSNGFRFNASSVTVNGSGNTYLYMCFAENPFTANVDGGLPTTAR